MGSFYSTCSITHTTLKNQRVARILLVPSASSATYDSRDHIKGKGLLVSNDGAQAMFTTFGFPVFGLYDDYGQLHQIEQTPSVKLLEDFFNLKIGEIFEAASDDRWIEYGIVEYQEELAKKERGEEYNEYRLNDTMFRPTWLEHVKNLHVLRECTHTDIRAEIYEEMAQPWFKTKTWDYKYCHEALDRILENTKHLRPWDPGRTQYDTLSGSLCKYDFMNLMKLNTRAHMIDITKMFWFLRNMSGMYRFLTPSNYGGQECNYDSIIRINNLIHKLIVADKIRDEED